MRILIATYSNALVGGVEKYVHSVIPALMRRGHTVGLVYERSFSASDTIDLPGVPSWCSSELGVPAVMRSISDWKPDVVYSQGVDDRLLECALLERFRAILYTHTYYGTCISGRKCHSWPRMEPCDRALGPGCIVLYHARRCGGVNVRTMWRLFQIQSARKRSFADYERILVASAHMGAELLRNGAGPQQLQLLPLFSPESRPQSLARTKRPEGRILFIGRLMDVKGVDYLLEATALAAERLEAPPMLTVAGDGPDRVKLENTARRLGLSVNFAGWVNGEKKAALFRQADLVAVPSLWPEPFGLVGIEAGSFGVPAVGFAVGGIRDWLIPGQTGELAPGDPPTASGLADAIIRSLSHREHYDKLCAGALEMARRFSLERHIEQLDQILTAVTSAPQPVAAPV